MERKNADKGCNDSVFLSLVPNFANTFLFLLLRLTFGSRSSLFIMSCWRIFREGFCWKRMLFDKGAYCGRGTRTRDDNAG